MQTEERMDSTLTHRKTEREKTTKDDEDKDSDVNSSENKVEDEKSETQVVAEVTDPPKLRLQEDFTTWGTVKYRFYLFRYYHYYYADKLDKYLAAGCLWIMRIYFRFIGLVEDAETRNEE
ncbi:uncharacterized protein LOC122502011 [Leptopilina heterotoma]|uniref:uncharacterized protein LOC122502011 n=1 Tax=Leptopilina heterotoma TaxID=63436 RepID=UPI001CA97DAE|nr:uncharacterized protein LOC122502011 [Leptopilina heterotoma]XP_043467788.1 uncharacterized protein LOC122502011 [Leptopilina heterotoma]